MVLILVLVFLDMTQHFYFSFPVEQEVHSSACGSDAAEYKFPAVCECV